MSAGNVNRIIRAPGRLVCSPTDLGAAFPYGGIPLGKSRNMVLKSLSTRFRVYAEGLGEATDVLEDDQHYVAGCILRGFDDDAVQQLFPFNYSKGAVSGHAMLDVPAGQGPGYSGYTRRKVLLYVPDNPIDHPALLLYAGIADWAENVELAFQRGDELGLPVAIQCLRDTQSRILKLGRLADLTL
jgi:hypothetical protein